MCHGCPVHPVCALIYAPINVSYTVKILNELIAIGSQVYSFNLRVLQTPVTGGSDENFIREDIEDLRVTAAIIDVMLG